MAGYVVVLDANVLYGIEVTDLFATMATRRLFQPHWSAEILAEVVRNLGLRPDLDPHAIQRRIDHLSRALPAAAVQIPSALVDAMPVNDKDRHVLALAVHVGAPMSTLLRKGLTEVPPLTIGSHRPPEGLFAVDDGEEAVSVGGIADAHLDRGQRHWTRERDLCTGAAGIDEGGMGLDLDHSGVDAGAKRERDVAERSAVVPCPPGHRAELVQAVADELVDRR